jgi:3D (Asp-Asp-Asp) domain-containing protein
MINALMAVAALLIYFGIIALLIWDATDQIRHRKRGMWDKFLIITVFLALAVPMEAKADVRRGWATAYCTSGTTASGTQTTENRTVAGMRKDFGKNVHIWIDDGDGQIKTENFVGSYVIEDTGGAPIREGRVLDIYMAASESCRQFGGKRIIYLIEEEENDIQKTESQ